jgi:hypothetical protein
MGKHERIDRKSATGPIGGTAPEPAAEHLDSTLRMPRVDTPGRGGRRFGRRAVAGMATAVAVGVVALAAGTAGFVGASSPATLATDSSGGKPSATRPLNDKGGSERSAKTAEKSKAAKDNGDKAKQASPSPSYAGLCRAYRSKVGDHPGKALESPAFASLIKAAGGAGGVRSYCALVLAQKQGDRSDDSQGKGGENSQAKGQGQGQSERGNNGGD